MTHHCPTRVSDLTDYHDREYRHLQSPNIEQALNLIGLPNMPAARGSVCQLLAGLCIPLDPGSRVRSTMCTFRTGPSSGNHDLDLQRLRQGWSKFMSQVSKLRVGNSRLPSHHRHWLANGLACMERSGSGLTHIHWLFLDDHEAPVFASQWGPVLKRHCQHLGVPAISRQPNVLATISDTPRFDPNGLRLLRRGDRYLSLARRGSGIQVPAEPGRRQQSWLNRLSGRLVCDRLTDGLTMVNSLAPAARLAIGRQGGEWVVEWSHTSTGRVDPACLEAWLFEIEHEPTYTQLDLDHPLLIQAFDPLGCLHRLAKGETGQGLLSQFTDRGATLRTLFAYRHLGCLRRVRGKLELLDQLFDRNLSTLERHGLLSKARIVDGATLLLSPDLGNIKLRRIDEEPTDYDCPE